MSTTNDTLFYVKRAKVKLENICKKWKSPKFRAARALREADFYIGMLAWTTEETKRDLLAAIEVYRVFIDAQERTQ